MSRRDTAEIRLSGLAVVAVFVFWLAAPANIYGQWNGIAYPQPTNSQPTSSQPTTRVKPSEVQENIFYWPRTELTIPFDVAPSGKLPKEIQLEVSIDGGASWSFYARSDLSNSNFNVKSAGDGLYLFRLKSFDERGQAFPSNDPPYQVIIDTQRPSGELTVDVDATGRMIVDFSLVEPNLKQESIRLEYQTELQSGWIAIPHETSSGQRAHEVTGRGAFELASGAKRLIVRLIAVDQAGNELELTRFPEMLRTAMSNGSLQLASQKGRNTSNAAAAQGPIYRHVDAGPQSGPSIQPNSPVSLGTTNGSFVGSSPGPNNATRTPLPSQYPDARSQQSPTTGLNAFGPQPNALGPGQGNLASTNQERGSAIQIFGPEGNGVANPKSTLPAGVPSQVSSLKPDGTYTLREIPAEEIVMPESIDRSTLGIPITASVPNTVTKPTNPNDWLTQTMRTSERPFFSNSLAFSLEYEIDSDAQPNVAAIELWGTLDAGKTWERWSQDPDGKSPFDIKVASDGLFGFRMVLVGRNGLMSNRPRDGDQPDVWVLADTKLPAAKITSALYGQASEAGSLIIQYNAGDDFPSDRPVTLSFAALADGPWTTIATGIPNTGRYAWPADPGLPRRIYLRIDFVDQAGNVASNRLDVPVDVQGLAPRGRISGFRTLNDGR